VPCTDLQPVFERIVYEKKTQLINNSLQRVSIYIFDTHEFYLNTSTSKQGIEFESGRKQSLQHVIEYLDIEYVRNNMPKFNAKRHNFS